jgi:hypothetical protein
MKLDMMLADIKVPLLATGPRLDGPDRLTFSLDDEDVLHFIVGLLRVSGATVKRTLVNYAAGLHVDAVGSTFFTTCKYC